MAVQDPPATSPVLQQDDKLLSNTWLDWLRRLGIAVTNSSGGGGSGGGSVTSGSQTLTSTSNKAQRLVFTAPGQYVKLPDATTCSTGTNLFGLYNASEYWGKIIDSTGVIRGFIAPQTRVGVDLAGNGTAAGVWDLDGAMLYGVTAVLRSVTSISTVGGVARHYAIALDADRTMLLRAGTTILATVYDQAGNTWGNEATVRSPILNLNWSAIKSAANQVLVISDNGSLFDAVTITTSGTTSTVNTGTRTTTGSAGGSGNSFGEMIAVGSTFVWSYSRATTTQALRGITISGTTPSIGAELTVSTTGLPTANQFTNPNLYAVSASVGLAMGCTASAGSMFATPFSVSGNTLTAGTSTTSALGPGFIFRTHAFGSRWLLIWGNGAGGSNVQAMLVSVSGTVASSSVASPVLSGTTANTLAGFDSCLVGAKAFVVSCIGGTFWFNVLTDTAGTLTAGTAILSPNSNGVTGCGIARVDGNLVRVLGTVQSGPTTSKGDLYTLDCSGASPVVSQTDSLGWLTSAQGYPSHPNNGTRFPFKIKAGIHWGYVIGADQATDATLLIGPVESSAVPARIPYMANMANNAWLTSGGGCGVVSDYDTWINGLTMSASPRAGQGGAIYRIQGAQP